MPSAMIYLTSYSTHAHIDLGFLAILSVVLSVVSRLHYHPACSKHNKLALTVCWIHAVCYIIGAPNVKFRGFEACWVSQFVASVASYHSAVIAGCQRSASSCRAAGLVTEANGQQSLSRLLVHGTDCPCWNDFHPLQERLEP